MMFGRRYQIGNYVVFKFNKVLKKFEIAELRNQIGIPKEDRKMLQRAQLPYIKVEAGSGIWAVEFCCNTAMYQYLDAFVVQAVEADEEGIELEDNNITDLSHVFSMMFTDTCILGDAEYTQDKGNALQALMERRKAREVSEEEDMKELDGLRQEEETKATILDMAGSISAEKGGSDD